MSIRVQNVAVASPFRILREQVGLSLEEMSGAIYLRPETLRDLEDDRWYKSTLGLPMVNELLSRVACVSAALLELPGKGVDASEVWTDAFCELGNSFNDLCWKA